MGSDPAVPVSRREQWRQQTRAEIKARSIEQIGSGGVEALSLNAVARAMAMSPAAIYRYFASRSELLDELVADGYDSLANALAAAAQNTRTEAPSARFITVARACRTWALDDPHAYRMVFHTTQGAGSNLNPEPAIAAAQRSMDVLLDILSEFDVPDRNPLDPVLAGQLHEWGQRTTHSGLSPHTLHLAIMCWTRLHGLISLELSNHIAATKVDPALLYDTEVQDILAGARASRRPSP